MSANKDLQANYDTFILSYKKYYATTENYNVELFDMLQNKISLFIKKKITSSGSSSLTPQAKLNSFQYAQCPGLYDNTNFS